MKPPLLAALAAMLFLGAGCTPSAKKQLPEVTAKERQQVQALLAALDQEALSCPPVASLQETGPSPGQAFLQPMDSYPAPPYRPHPYPAPPYRPQSYLQQTPSSPPKPFFQDTSACVAATEALNKLRSEYNRESGTAKGLRHFQGILSQTRSSVRTLLYPKQDQDYADRLFIQLEKTVKAQYEVTEKYEFENNLHPRFMCGTGEMLTK